jgi:hypothetical protein
MAIRAFRWLLVPIYAAFIIAFVADRPSYLTWNGQVSHNTEAVMFGVPVFYVFRAGGNHGPRKRWHPTTKQFQFQADDD